MEGEQWGPHHPNEDRPFKKFRKGEGGLGESKISPKELQANENHAATFRNKTPRSVGKTP